VPDWSEIRCRFPPKSPAAFDRNQVPVCSDFCTRLKTRADFVQRVTLRLNSLYREGTVEKIGSEMEACAKAAPYEYAEPTTALRALFGLAGSIVLRCR
jgi:hypothetical protein